MIHGLTLKSDPIWVIYILYYTYIIIFVFQYHTLGSTYTMHINSNVLKLNLLFLIKLQCELRQYVKYDRVLQKLSYEQ